MAVQFDPRSSIFVWPSYYKTVHFCSFGPFYTRLIFWNHYIAGNWDGDEIDFNVNGERQGLLEGEFNKFEFCRRWDEVDVENDQFQLQSKGDDGVCITSLTVNGNEMLVGKLNDQPSFWIDGNQNHCRDGSMSTPQITIKNGKVLSSSCKGIK